MCKGSVLVTKAVEHAQGKCTVLATKAVGRQGKGSVLVCRYQHPCDGLSAEPKPVG